MAKKAATKKTTTKASTQPTKTSKKTTAKKTTTKQPAKKMSMLDAAATVLADSSEPMACKPMITAMAEQKLWVSPGGKTPHATLYAALLREINKKGDEARFQKVDKGLFTLAAK